MDLWLRRCLLSTLATCVALVSGAAPSLRPESPAIVIQEGTSTTVSVVARSADGEPIAGRDVYFAVGEKHGALIVPFSLPDERSPRPGAAPPRTAGTESTQILTATDSRGVARATFRAKRRGEGVLLIRAALSDGSAATTIPVTVVRSTHVDPVLDAGSASAFVREGVLRSRPASWAIHGPVLLEKGTSVRTPLAELNLLFPSEKYTTTERSWLFWVDEAPDAFFAHASQFLYVSAEADTPSLTHSARHGWWPQIAIPDKDHIDELSVPQVAILRDSPVVNDKRFVDWGRAPHDPVKTCAILVYGPDAAGDVTEEKMQEFLTGSGRVPAGNMFTTAELTTPAGDSRPASSADIEALVAKARTNGCEKVYFHLGAHAVNRQRSLSNGQLTASDALVTLADGEIDYTTLRGKLSGLAGLEVCMVIDTCYSGEAVNWVQGNGFTGTIVTAADDRHTSLYSESEGSFYSKDLIDCWNDPKSDTDGNGFVSIEEAHACVLGKKNDDVTPFNPQVAVIDPQGSLPIGIPDVAIPEPENLVTITILRPDSVATSVRITGTLTIGSPSIAAFASGSSGVFAIPPGSASQTVQIRGVAEGTTSLTFEGRDEFTGQSLRGQATIQVGSHYITLPRPFEVEAGGSRGVFVNRQGILAGVRYGYTVDVRSLSPTVAVPVETQIQFTPGAPASPLTIRGLAPGTGQIELEDKLHGITFHLRVRVVAQAGKVSTPVISPPGGTYTAPQQATIGVSEAGATVRYTTDGSEPGPSSATAQPVAVDRSMTVRARAFKIGMEPSDIAGAAYELRCATPSFTPAQGTFTTSVQVQIATTSPGCSVRYELNGNDPSSSSPAALPILIQTTTTVRARAFRDGWTASEVASGTFTIIPPEKVQAPVISPPGGTYFAEQICNIATSTAGAVVRYTTNGLTPTESDPTSLPIGINASMTVKARAFKPGMLPSDVVEAQYVLKVRPVVFNPVAGPFSAPFNAHLSTTTPGATIRYTIDGSEPTMGSASSIPIGVTQTITITARAFKAGWEPSDITSATYTFVPPACALAGLWQLAFASLDDPDEHYIPIGLQQAILRILLANSVLTLQSADARLLQGDTSLQQGACTFSMSGYATVLGEPTKAEWRNVTVANGQLTAQYALGLEGEFPGGRPIIYSVTGTQAQAKE